MFLTDHTGEMFHYGEGKHKLITAVTAFIFDKGIIYHIGYENGDVEVLVKLNGPGVFLGQESFKLPDVRLPTLEVDFTQVALLTDRYEGSVTIGSDIYPVPSQPSVLRRNNFLDDPEFIAQHTLNDTDGFAGAYVVPESQLTAPPGEPTYVTVNTPDPETRVYEGSPFTRMSFIVNDDFTVRAVPEVRAEPEDINEENLPY